MTRLTFCTFNEAFADKPIFTFSAKLVFSAGISASFPVLSDIIPLFAGLEIFPCDEGLESVPRTAERCSCLVVVGRSDDLCVQGPHQATSVPGITQWSGPSQSGTSLDQQQYNLAGAVNHHKNLSWGHKDDLYTQNIRTHTN